MTLDFNTCTFDQFLNVGISGTISGLLIEFREKYGPFVDGEFLWSSREFRCIAHLFHFQSDVTQTGRAEVLENPSRKYCRPWFNPRPQLKNISRDFSSVSASGESNPNAPDCQPRDQEREYRMMADFYSLLAQREAIFANIGFTPKAPDMPIKNINTSSNFQSKTDHRNNLDKASEQSQIDHVQMLSSQQNRLRSALEASISQNPSSISPRCNNALKLNSAEPSQDNNSIMGPKDSRDSNCDDISDSGVFSNDYASVGDLGSVEELDVAPSDQSPLNASCESTHCQIV